MTQKQKSKLEKRFDKLIRKADLDEYDENTIRALKKAYMAGASYALTLSEGGWTSVEDELPPCDTEEFVGLYNGRPAIGIFASQAEALYDISNSGLTHWMPLNELPELPEKGWTATKRCRHFRTDDMVHTYCTKGIFPVNCAECGEGDFETVYTRMSNNTEQA